MTHPNEELIRKGYAAFSNGDMDTVRATFADDIKWHISGRSFLAGDYDGLDEVFGFFAKFISAYDRPPVFELHDVLANDEHAVALVSADLSRNGKNRTTTAAHVFHIKDGKSTEFWGHPFDAYADDEILAD
ncbi:MAG: nuclear transport factor 2 family protein [Actinomycetota bacterium]|nr:nuclear transport factor 2 family protein [Actinomycetota bacterium]